MMKKFTIILAAVLLVLLLGSPVLAASLGISPTHTELEVPGDGSTTANFKVYYFSGDLKVSLEGIPLAVEPQTVHVERSSEPVDIEVTIYGDESLGSKIYDGYIMFLGMSGGTVAVAVKVRAKVTNLVEGETPVLAAPEESQPPAPVQPAPAPPAPTQPTPATPGVVVLPAPTTSEQAPPAPPEGSTAVGEPITPPLPPAPPAPSGTEWPILPIAGIAAGAAIIITLIVVLLRRPRY